MRSWPRPYIPQIPGTGPLPALHDTKTGTLHPCQVTSPATLYVCGITPYDAAHIGHAATYVGYDLLHRAWIDAGKTVTYVQNITDIDDPLLERATATNVPWDQLATAQIETFRNDMTALGVIPPHHFVAVTDVIPEIADAVATLTANGHTYEVPVTDGTAVHPGAVDVYADFATDTDRVDLLHDTDEARLALFAERGGDPDRDGKRHPLDPLVWRAARHGEPSWVHPGVGPGRPGWHIECSVISSKHLGACVDVTGGGRDLIFPHHEMSLTHTQQLTGKVPGCSVHSHTGMVGLNGEKMSKSRGNLVFVHDLLAAGHDPMAIRLALLSQHYRADWEWTDDILARNEARLTTWRYALSRESALPEVDTITAIRNALADDLNAPAALAAIDDWAAAHESAAPPGPEHTSGLLSRAIDALLGVRF